MAFQPNSPAARDAAFFMHPYTNARAHEIEALRRAQTILEKVFRASAAMLKHF